jgi:hypothetical protein
MPLVDVSLPDDVSAIPSDVQAFLDEAGRRIERFQRASHLPGFVPSDYGRTYLALASLEQSNLPAGNWFCEWGSGFGVTTCLASLLGFEAWGIEIEEELVEAARRLADDFELAAEFVCGSFIPSGDDLYAVTPESFAWLSTDTSRPGLELEIAPDDFDLIFSYPWPDEERLTAALFERHARGGALLLSYHEVGSLRLRRKTGKAERPWGGAGAPRSQFQPPDKKPRRRR